MFPKVIDSTLLSLYRGCPEKARLRAFRGWTPATESIHLHAGGAYAAGLEAARQAFFHLGKSKGEAEAIGLQTLLVEYGDYQCDPEDSKSLQRMLGALEYYFSQYPLDSDYLIPHSFPTGKGVEYSFLEPLERNHPETGEPLIFSGRMDMVVDYNNAIFGYDDKTTTQLGPTWASQWDMRAQFSAYTWGARKAGIPMTGFIVRGLCILKKNYKTAEAVTYRPDWMVKRWEKSMYFLLDRMLEDYKKLGEEVEWETNQDDTCTAYGGCEFKKFCLMQPEGKESWLSPAFTRAHWDPVTRTRIPV